MNKIKISGVDEILYHDILPNGLNVYMLPNKNVLNFYITFNTYFGSIYNNFKSNKMKSYKTLPKGVAHFLEHTTFYLSDGDASEHFYKLGSESNAYTSFDITCYEVTGNTKFKENLDFLLDFVQTPYYNEKNIKEEKGIICEEIKMYDDIPESNAFFKMYENLFHTSEYKYKVAGTVEDVKKTTLNDILDSYNTFYHPSNMFVIITGNFNPEEALSIIQENQAKKDYGAALKIDFKRQHEKSSVVKKTDTIKSNVLIGKVSIGIKVPLKNFSDIKISNEELHVYVSLIVNSMFGRSSLIKEHLVSNNIITDGIYTDIMYTDEYLVITLISETKYKERYTSIMEDTIKNIDLNEEELIRKSRVAISNLILSFNDIEMTNLSIQEDLLNHGEFINNYFDIYNNLNIKIAKKICNIIKVSPYTILNLVKKDEESE